MHSAGTHPEIIVSNRHGSLIASVALSLPLTDHVYCLHHLDRNVTQRLCPVLGGQWAAFSSKFWATYRDVSPDEFDQLWTDLVTTYPSTADYLNEELYLYHKKWAWARVNNIFTAGVHTNDRVESEIK